MNLRARRERHFCSVVNNLRNKMKEKCLDCNLNNFIPKKYSAKATPDSNDFNAYHFYARNLRNLFRDLLTLAAMHHDHVIGITRLHISDRYFIEEYSLPEYTIFNCEKETKIGGAVILYS